MQRLVVYFSVSPSPGTVTLKHVLVAQGARQRLGSVAVYGLGFFYLCLVVQTLMGSIIAIGVWENKGTKGFNVKLLIKVCSCCCKHRLHTWSMSSSVYGGICGQHTYLPCVSSIAFKDSLFVSWI